MIIGGGKSADFLAEVEGIGAIAKEGGVFASKDGNDGASANVDSGAMARLTNVLNQRNEGYSK